MKKIGIFIVLFVSMSTLFVFGQRVNFKGTVIDGITFYPIDGANIYNISTNQYSFTNKEGVFFILAKASDTIIITKGVYRQHMAVISSSEVNIGQQEYMLYYKAIILKEVQVVTLNPSYNGFKREVTNMKLPDVYKRLSGTEISDEEKMGIEYANNSPNILRNTKAASPITFFYETFSRKSKMNKLVQELEDNKENVEQVQYKYNREIVERITGLQGNDLLDFMMYCRFGYYDIIRWSPEYIVSKIKEKYTNYEYEKAIQMED